MLKAVLIAPLVSIVDNSGYQYVPQNICYA